MNDTVTGSLTTQTIEDNLLNALNNLANLLHRSVESTANSRYLPPVISGVELRSVMNEPPQSLSIITLKRVFYRPKSAAYVWWTPPLSTPMVQVPHEDNLSRWVKPCAGRYDRNRLAGQLYMDAWSYTELVFILSLGSKIG